ncbi:MAG: hypothetical protein KKC66_04295 [Candidatus Omnitrophica bacterium]|nr:hypothetical protein [Candidatus Omnitrophota bacterium]MBU1933101.1 hypothetical protein [Candidatus Omnitrophota bacterium]
MTHKITVGLLSAALIFVLIGLVYAGRETGSVLLPEETLQKIFEKLDKISREQDAMKSRMNTRLDQILANQEAAKDELKTIRIRSFR